MQTAKTPEASLPPAIQLARAAVACLLAVAALAGCERRLPPAQQVEVRNVVALRSALGGSAADSSTTAAAAPAAEPTGWATIRGSFKLNGPPPERPPLNVDKDVQVCAPGGKQVLSEELVVDSSGGIKDVVIYLSSPAKFPIGDPKWEHSDYSNAQEITPEFDQKNCVFLSHVFVMRSNQKLKVLNSDPVGHNTNISGGGKANPDNITVASNSYQMYSPGGESAEPFPVSCNIHPWMSARILVRDSPYFDVTAPDGSFEIANVPAGVPLEFRVWQEKAKFVQDVTVNGKAEKWSKGRMKIKLEPDEQRTLDVVVDAAVFSK